MPHVFLSILVKDRIVKVGEIGPRQCTYRHECMISNFAGSRQFLAALPNHGNLIWFSIRRSIRFSIKRLFIRYISIPVCVYKYTLHTH